MTLTYTPSPTTLDRPPHPSRRVSAPYPLPPPRHETVDTTGAFESMSIRSCVETWGQSSVSPFNLGADRELLGRPGVYGTGFIRRRRWAVMATDIAAVPGFDEDGLTLMLEALRTRHLHPTLAAVTDPEPYRRRGLWTTPVADDPLIDLTDFSLSGKSRSSIRHSVTSARRAGLRVVPWAHEWSTGASAVSDAWLATKRGGEMGFTLGRFDPTEMQTSDCRVAVNGDSQVLGFVTWHHFDGGRGRVLDLMRRLPDAPNPTMDLLIADGLTEFAAAGIKVASLGCVPRSSGAVAERFYPTTSLRRYKSKFNPQWEPRHLVAPSKLLAPAALRALARCFVSGGLLTATRRNG